MTMETRQRETARTDWPRSRGRDKQTSPPPRRGTPSLLGSRADSSFVAFAQRYTPNNASPRTWGAGRMPDAYAINVPETPVAEIAARQLQTDAVIQTQMRGKQRPKEYQQHPYSRREKIRFPPNN